MNTNIPTITVDPELRELILPSKKLVLGINGDVEVNAVQFQLPLTYRELELKKLTARINYVNPNGDTNYYESTMESDESNCYFIWPITPDITAYAGHVRFSLTLYQTEGDNILHKFNTRSATGRVYTGFEAEKQVTPEQQQTLLSKLETQIKEELNDHTEKLKDQLTEKGKEILDGFGESGNVSEELKTIKQDLGTKLTAPPTPKVGKILKIKSVNEDGTFTCEWADDGGSNLDVRIDGKSIVQDGVAEIPLCTASKAPGLISIDLYSNVGGLYRANSATGLIRIANAKNTAIDERENSYCPIVPANLDYAVKAAMCDGKGTAWTPDEQAAARERMGAWTGGWQIIMDETLAELAQEVSFKVPDDTKEMICFFKSGAAPASTPVYLRTNNINSEVAESFASFGGSLANNVISIGCQKIQFLNSQYGLVEYSYLSHSTPSSTDNAQRVGKTSVLRIDNKRFAFHSTNRNTGYPAETRLLVLVRRQR